MAIKTLTLKVITPNGYIYNGNANMVTVRTISGYRGILPNHAPLVSSLISGDLRIHIASNNISNYHISSGLLIVNKNIVKILTNSAREKI